MVRFGSSGTNRFGNESPKVSSINASGEEVCCGPLHSCHREAIDNNPLRTLQTSTASMCLHGLRGLDPVRCDEGRCVSKEHAEATQSAGQQMSQLGHQLPDTRRAQSER